MSRKIRKINKVLTIVQYILLAAIAVALIVLISLGIRLLAGNLKEKKNPSGAAADPPAVIELSLPEAAEEL